MDESTPRELPELPDETVRRIEERVFAGIEAERSLDRAAPAAVDKRRGRPSRGRRGLWTGLVSGAAVVLLAAVVAPSVLSSLNGPDATWSTATRDAAPEFAHPDAGGSSDSGATSDSASEGDTAEREVVLTGSTVLVVDDVQKAADAVVSLAERHGGHVDGQQISRDGKAGADGGSAPGDGSAPYDEAVTDDTLPVEGGSWVSVRVPADDISAVIDELAGIGEVDSSRLTSEDVTMQAVDLRARVDAAQTSVERLTELMSQAGSVGDLLAAEESLSARQAELESYRQQLEQLEDRVAMAGLTVSLTTSAPPLSPGPAGFGDGLAAGWNGLLAALGGLVVGLGFLLPWLLIVAVVVLVWLAVRAVRRSRRQPSEPENPS